MPTEIIMPQMGFDMKEGTLVRWIKKEGEQVAKGEPIAEIETDKAVVEVEAYDSGLLRKVFISEGTTVPVGQVIGIIGRADEPLPAGAPAGPAAPPRAGAAPAGAEGARAKPEADRGAPAAAPPPREIAERIKASPLARKEAETLGVDLARVRGTGPGGRVTRKDVLHTVEEAGRAPAPAGAPAAHAAPAAPAAATGAAAGPPMPALGELVPLTRMRQAIARNMSRSKQEIPHFYVTVAVDMTEAVRLRQQLNQALGGETKVSVNDMIVKATAKTLVKHTVLNAVFAEGGIQVQKQINIGIAVAMEGGLIAPAILEADRKTLVEVARESKGLAERARAGKLHAQEYTSATFTVTNLGMYSVESFSAIITPPQSAALAVGAAQQEAVVRDGQVKVADVMRLTLSIDHRVADGAQAANFLRDVKAALENPVSLLL